MKIKSNFKWNIEELQKSIEDKYTKILNEGRLPHSILIHPETLISILTSDEYFELHKFQAPDSKLFHFKVTGDPSMHLGEWKFLVIED